MATQQSAQVYITNTTDGQATITLYHNNSSNGTQNGTWQANPGQQVGPLTVYFETGWGSWGILDYWAVEIAVTGGSTPGVYESSGILQYSDWKECQLQSPDAGKNLPLHRRFPYLFDQPPLRWLLDSYEPGGASNGTGVRDEHNGR